jgi:hypothetical protein
MPGLSILRDIVGKASKMADAHAATRTDSAIILITILLCL